MPPTSDAMENQPSRLRLELCVTEKVSHGCAMQLCKAALTFLCGREFMNSLADSSFAEVKAAIASEKWLADFFDVGETYIRTKCWRITCVFAGCGATWTASNPKREFSCWSSHGADGLGPMCVHYDQPDGAPPPRERYSGRRSASGGGGSWQSA
jgi:hypothetical protein